jgi:hypothetical protein
MIHIRSAASTANTDEPRRAVEHPSKGIPELGQHGRTVAVRAGERVRSPPRRFQSRPGDAVVRDAIPGIARPSPRRRPPIVGLSLEAQPPFAEVESQGEVGGERLAEQVVVAGSGDGLLPLPIQYDDFDYRSSQPLFLEEWSEIGKSQAAPVMDDDPSGMKLDQIEPATPLWLRWS